MKVVLKIGGSILLPSPSVNNEVFRRWKEAIAKISNQVEKMAIVVGGGRIAREYIRAADFASSYEKDLLGISITRVNAYLLMLYLKYSNLDVAFDIPTNPEDVRKLLQDRKLVVLGGYLPGNSTAGVAALTAEAISADLLLVATNVPGIFEEDPRTNPNARKLKKVHISKLIQMLSVEKSVAGTYFLLDLLALKVLERSKIPTIVFDGRNPENAVSVLVSYITKDYESIFKYGSLITF